MTSVQFDSKQLVSPAQTVRYLEPVFRALGRRGPAPASLAHATRILVVSPEDKIGDVVLATPFLRELRRNAPAAEITLLLHPALKLLMANCPYVDRILFYPRWKPRAFGQLRRFVHEIAWTRQNLWPLRFDLALVTSSQHRIYRQGALAYLSGATCRIAPCPDRSAMWEGEPGEESFYTRILPPSLSEIHEAQRCLSLIPALGGSIADTRTELWPDASDLGHAQTLLPEQSPAVPRVALMVGSSVPGRRWPAESFAELARWLTGDLRWQVVLVGGEADRLHARQVAAACASGVLDLTGRTSIGQTVAVLARCQLYLGNDTGPMHMAAAMKVPVVEISCHPEGGDPLSERSPARFGPWGVPAWIARPASVEGCRDFCHPGEEGAPHCILRITVEQVMDLVRQAAAATGLI